MLLKARGYEVRDYANGLDLLADATCGQAECLVTDYHMPVIDGFSLLGALRERKWTAPAILISGDADDALESRSIGGGFAALVRKPITDDRLMTTLAQLVGMPSAGA